MITAKKGCTILPPSNFADFQSLGETGKNKQILPAHSVENNTGGGTPLD